MNGNNPLESRIEAQPFFEGITPEYLDIVASGARQDIFQPGQIVFHENQPANRFYLIESGRVALETRGESGRMVVIEVLEAGEVLGWSWLFAPFTWHFQARALDRTHVLVLDAAHLLVEAERNHDFGYGLMKRVAQVLIHRLQVLRQQLVEAELHPV